NANAGTSARSGRLTIAGHEVAVAQEGRAETACTYELSPTTADFSKDGGGGTVAVSARDGCAWTARSNAAWAVIEGDGRGSGTDTVAYSVSRHSDVSVRTADIDVADRRLTVRQSGDVGACQYSVAPVSLSPCMPGGTAVATVTTSPSCPWTATSGASWLGLSSGSSGTGTAPVTIAYSDNYDAPREGVVMVRWPTPTAGQNIHVAQA